MSFLCQVFSPSVSVSNCIYEGLSLYMLFYLTTCFPSVYDVKWVRQQSWLSVISQNTHAIGRSMLENAFLKRPFLQLARIQWHLVVVVGTFLLKTEDIPLHPFLFSFVLLWRKDICNLPWAFKFYFTGFPIKCMVNIKYIEAMFAGHFFSFIVLWDYADCYFLKYSVS